jgi:four helix bundle protein
MENNTSRNYRDLIAWQKAMDLMDLIYTTSRSFPKQELYGLTSQIRRAAVSVPSNIAEGQGRRTKGEFQQALSVAHGSIREVETQITIATRQGFTAPEVEAAVLNLAAEVGRLVQGLMHSLTR